MTNPEYILEFMRDNDYRYFNVTNSYDVDTQKQFNGCELDEGIRRMERFLKNSTGFHRIKLYQSNECNRQGRPVERPQIFEVSLTGKEFAPKEEPGLNGTNPTGILPSPSGAIVGVDQYLSKHEEVASLKADLVRLTMENQFLRDAHARELESMRRDHESKLKEAKDSQAMVMQGLSAMASGMNLDFLNNK